VTNKSNYDNINTQINYNQYYPNLLKNINKGEWCVMPKIQGPTEVLVKYLTNLTYDDLPAEVVDKVKLCVYDYIGHTVYACGERPANILCATSYELGGNEQATTIGYGFRTNVVQAALINGTMGHMTELDDTHLGSSSHPGDSIIPAALAVAEKCKNNGKEIIAAIAAGYEIAIRAGVSVMPSHYDLGWHPSGTVNTFGAAIAAGKLLGLSVWQMRHAVGLAGALTSGNFAHVPERGMAKDFNTGRAAASGVYAAIIAQRGFTGSSDFFENDRGGFCRLYAREADLSKLTNKLGQEFKIMEVAHKPYTACRHAHGAIDATLQIVEEENIKPEEVNKINVRINATGAKFVDDKMPWLEEKGYYGSRFSAQFNVAVALLEGREGLMNLIDKQYVRNKLDDPKVRKYIDLIGNIIWDKEIDEFPKSWATIVEIETPRGSFSRRVDYPKGEPQCPLTIDEMKAKFKRLVTAAGLSPEQERKLTSEIFKLETLSEVDEIMSLAVVPNISLEGVLQSSKTC